MKLSVEVKRDICDQLSNQAEKHAFLKNLLQQSCSFLQSETSGVVVCLSEDCDIVSQLLDDVKLMNLTLHNEKHLSKEEDIGGLNIIVQKGNIQCCNSIAQRIKLALQETMPDIRKTVFENQSD